VVDIFRNTVFVGTGDNYRHPLNTAESVAPYANYGACIAKEPEASCLSPNDHFDSILALDMNTGQIKWSVKEASWNQQSSVEGIVNGSDDWNVDCLIEGFDPAAVQCPTNHGPDYDFGSAPNEITYLGPWGIPQTIIGAGQKSGIYYALDPDTGAQLWRTQVGPGSALGGIEWGSASDGQRIYVAISNYFGYPNAAGGNAGSWAALDPATGKILWQTPDPNGAIDLSPMAVANGVVYAASMAGTATAQNMLALDASTGKTLWTFEAGSSVIAGASVAGGTVYWGSGYTHLGLPGQIGGKNLFFAFSVNGQ
jgi:polyvinyl alcohol dehydrogenase (cytochrome)